MIIKTDRKNQFRAFFDPTSGFYMRTGIIKDGKDTGEDPFMTVFPELLDVGIMGSCAHGRLGLCAASGVECYQNGADVCQPDMKLEDFRRIAEECREKTFQFALGGRGDPDMHPNFREILECCRENSIVPNFTTSGLGMTREKAELCKEFCGAVAVSWYRQPHTLNALKLLLEAGVKTNIHFVLGQNTIGEAAELLKNGGFPRGINAVIFLLHKPVGSGSRENMLKYGDERLVDFLEFIDENEFQFGIGFDSCSAPALISYMKNTDRDSFDTCEGGRWSAYITPDMKLLPCSFDNDKLRWAYDISCDTIENGWNSPQFEDFRNRLRSSCPDCPERSSCMGGCPICPEIVLCGKRRQYHEVQD